jgi:aspartate aminotransferase-like enzyme
MHDRNWHIAPGWGDLRDSTIRIGHMGDVTPNALGELLRSLSEVAAAMLVSPV